MVSALACGARELPPSERAHDARFGYLAGGEGLPEPSAACGGWGHAVGGRDSHAMTHVSFAEVMPGVACYTRVVHEGRSVLVGHVPEGCGVPRDPEREAMIRLAEVLEHEPDGPTTLMPCALTPGQRAAAKRHNAAVLRDVARRPGTFPYAAVIVPGYGEPAQAGASTARWLPGDPCIAPEEDDGARFGVMVERTRRAADALSAGVAPMAIVSGGAVHSSAVEAFEMLHMLECTPGASVRDVIVEPCAEHTHTNLRDAARWLVAMGSRTAYLVTDDGLQADYFQDLTGFEFIGGSIDQRSLRDWGYVIGSWRQASVGTASGFWFTPYRFWAEPRGGLGSFTCVDRGR